MPFDKFGHPFWYPSKVGGFFWEQPDDPENDEFCDFPDEMDFNGGGIMTMNPNGPTDWGCGKNISSFNDSIGGCNMDFADTAERGYAYKADDARDLEIKAIVDIRGTGDNGFSISACTGHHTNDNCCQGFAYMITTEVASNPSEFNFRKEMWHVSYHDSPLGTFEHPKCDFRIRDVNRYVGIGFCRYNDPNDIDGTVVVEVWFNPDPDDNKADWTMLKRFKDTHGAGWGNDGDDCGGFSDQPGTWSNAQNRFKTNATNGSIKFKQCTLREIDPTGDFGGGPDPNPPPPGPGPGPTPTEPLKYTFSFKFGSKGNGNGQFQDPHDITFDSTGANMWICDRVRNDIQKFTSAGVYVSKFGSAGSGNGQFNVPYAIQINPAFTHLYVCDRENNRVQKLTTAGAWVSNITSANGKSFNKPEDICFNSSNGDIFICDTGNNRVVKFNSSHVFQLEWDGSDSGDEFDHPHSMDITTDNTHIIMNCGNQPTITKWTTSGTFVKKWGSEGNGQGQVRLFLEHMDIDAFGRVHLINNDVRPIINVWDEEGHWLCQYGSTTSGSGNGQFKEPEHVTVQDSTGNPYVVDAKNQRIQVFTPNFTTPPDPDDPPPPPPPPTGGGGGGTSKIIGSFTLLRDINIGRTSACQGSGGGGGSGGSAKFYADVPAENDSHIVNHSTRSNRTRNTEIVGNNSSILRNKILKQMDVWLKEEGSPAATPTISAKIWASNGAVMATSSTNLDPTTLTGSFAKYSFDFSANTHVNVVGDRIGIEYLGTDEDNHIISGYQVTTSSGNQWTYLYENGAWVSKTKSEFAADFWQ